MAVLSIGDKRLGAVLLERGYVSDEALQQAIGRHSEVGGRLAEVLVSLGVLSEQRIARAIEESIGIPLVILPRVEVMPEALAKVPANVAYEVGAFPFALEGNRLRVAFEDPLDALAIEEIEDASGCTVEPYQALSKELRWALATYYPELGLEPPNDLEVDVSQRLGQLALERGYITEAQLKQAVAEQQRTGGLLGRILISQNLLSEAQLAQLLAEQAGLPYVEDLNGPFDDTLTSSLLRFDALQFTAVPWRWDGDALVVAVADPRRIPDVTSIVQRPLKFVVSTETAVLQRIEQIYADNKGRLGETLLQHRKLKREQLRRALEEQNKLGRVKPLGEILVDLGYVTQADIDEALNRQRTGGGRLEDTLVQSGKISPEMLAKSLAMQLGYEYIDINSVKIDTYAVTLVPETTVRRYTAMPVRLEGNTLVVAMKDPRHVFALDDIRLITGKEIQPAVATEEALNQLINRYYRGGEDMDELAKAVLEEVGTRETQEAEDTSAIDDNAIVKVVNNIIRDAVINDISDIHIEPRPDRILIRVRKDGDLREYMTMPKAAASAMAARIKIMGGLNIAERRVPQDGRVRFRDKSIEVDLRLSTLPTVYGEKAVMRILKKASNIPEIEQLGFADYNFQRFYDVIQKPYGMFLITGPTGSGKSFTTFSILKRLAVPEKNVTTIEDPVEYEIPGINQTQVNVKAGLTFATALRAFLRQDPDIIMVGEIRDTETAKIAVEAALTGHLLIATLHTNDAASVVTRLTEMGVEPFNVSASLIGVLAQRLVRRVCTHCKVEYTPDADVLRRIGLREEQIRGKSLYRGVGCEKCGGTGYNGRMAIHEFLMVDEELEAMIAKERPVNEIKEVAIRNGMRTLREDGIHKAFQGYTTLEEVLAKTTE